MREWEPASDQVELSDQVGYGTAEVDMYDPEVDLGIAAENLCSGERKGTLTMTEILIYAELNKFITTNEKIHAALAVILEELDIFSGEASE